MCGVVLDPHLPQAEALGEAVGADQRRAAGGQPGARLRLRALERQEVVVAPDVLRAALDPPPDRADVGDRLVLVLDLQRTEAPRAHVACLQWVLRRALSALELLRRHMDLRPGILWRGRTAMPHLTGIGTVPALAEWLPGLQRACPSTPLDVSSSRGAQYQPCRTSRSRASAAPRAGAARSTAPPRRPPRPRTSRSSRRAGLRWLHIERPQPADRAWLEEHFDFHPLDYEDVLSRNQRPKVDEYPEYLFVVLHFPRFDKSIGRLNAAELDMFVGPDFVITLPNEPLQPLEYLFERCKTREDQREALFAKGPGYLLYKIVDDCVDASFPMLRKMGNKLERLEEDIFEGRSGEIVRDISNVKQEIINFRKIVRPQRTALRDLERTKRYIPEGLDIYFDDINDASERIWDMLENFKEVVEGLESTNESVLSHQVNDVLKALTAISVVVLPLTLVASIWGMNVGVPGEGSHTAFWIVVGAMVALLAGMLGFFRSRGWL